jgi:STE24 endopeptidase
VYALEDDFTAEQIERARARKRDVRPLRYASMVIGLVGVGVLGFTPAGAAVVNAAGRVAGGGWIAKASLGAVGLYLVLYLLGLPLSARGEIVDRRWGLSTRSWGLFVADAVKGVAVSAVLIAAASTGFYALIRATDLWWIWAALAAAALAVVMSFLAPVVIAPLFNRFRPMAEGQLRTRLLSLAEQSGVGVRDILVSDGSRRTTAVNAYVSGIGRTRRVVVWDTTVDQCEPEEVAAIAAHELGHAAHRDVLKGTILGALGAAASVVVLAGLLHWHPLLTAAGVTSEKDPRSLALIAALLTLFSAIGDPLALAMSRRIEARADGYALDLVRDPETIAVMERRLAVTNIADLEPHPLVVLLLASHPPIRDRIAHARRWAAEHGVAVPGPLVDQA